MSKNSASNSTIDKEEKHVLSMLDSAVQEKDHKTIKQNEIDELKLMQEDLLVAVRVATEFQKISADQVDSLEKENMDVKKKLNSLENENLNLKQKLNEMNNLEKENVELKKKVNEMERQIKEIEGENL